MISRRAFLGIATTGLTAVAQRFSPELADLKGNICAQIGMRPVAQRFKRGRYRAMSVSTELR